MPRSLPRAIGLQSDALPKAGMEGHTGSGRKQSMRSPPLLGLSGSVAP